MFFFQYFEGVLLLTTINMEIKKFVFTSSCFFLTRLFVYAGSVAGVGADC